MLLMDVIERLKNLKNAAKLDTPSIQGLIAFKFIPKTKKNNAKIVLIKQLGIILSICNIMHNVSNQDSK